MFADFLIDGFPPKKSATALSKIIRPVHDKAQPQQSSTAENWLDVPEKNTDSADGTGPAFSRDTQRSRLQSPVNGNFATVDIFKARRSPFPGHLLRPEEVDPI